jgi:hypothetical protein
MPTFDASLWPLQRELEPDERTLIRPQITDETKIVRYVGLSTFLLYLSGHAFIPSLQLLRSSDVWEGSLWWERMRPDFERAFDDHLISFQEFFRDKFVYPKAALPPGADPAEFKRSTEFQTRYQCWLRELAKRRCAWCWNMFDGPSHALWKLYGAKGVIILSTVGKVKQALAPSEPLRWLVSPVRYSIPSRFMHPRTIALQTAIKWAPYLSKMPQFRYEQELRFVFGTNPRLTDHGPLGMLLKIDPKSLIEDILVSGDLPSDEAEIVKAMFSNFKTNDFKLPAYPKSSDNFWRSIYSQMNFNPFTIEDDPPGLFFDLEPEVLAEQPQKGD